VACFHSGGVCEQLMRSVNVVNNQSDHLKQVDDALFLSLMKGMQIQNYFTTVLICACTAAWFLSSLPTWNLRVCGVKIIFFANFL